MPLPDSSGTIPAGTSSGAGTSGWSGSGGSVTPGSGADSALEEGFSGVARGVAAGSSPEQPASSPQASPSAATVREIMTPRVGPAGWMHGTPDVPGTMDT